VDKKYIKWLKIEAKLGTGSTIGWSGGVEWVIAPGKYFKQYVKQMLGVNYSARSETITC